jgi:hypothetical protein
MVKGNSNAKEKNYNTIARNIFKNYKNVKYSSVLNVPCPFPLILLKSQDFSLTSILL